MAEIQNDDLFLVNRGDVSYKVTFAEIKESGGGSSGGGTPIEPTPGQETTSPPYDGGNGTKDNPYVISPADCFLAGEVYSSQTISFFGFTENQTVHFTDTGDAENGVRFAQPNGTINAQGQYSFKLRFEDIPETTAPPKSYTGVINCGEVYWTWTVSVLETGIEKPSISNIQGSDKQFVAAPTSPLFVTSAGPVASLNPGTVGTLTADQSTGSLSASGGSGNGLQADFTTDSNGNIIFIEITNGGSSYQYGDSVEFDLSSIGGASAQAMTAFVEPVTGPSAVFEITSFVGKNAGSFKEMQWEFSTDPTFPAGSTNSTTITSQTTTVIVGTGIGPNSQYYGRFKYVSSNDVTSAFSDTVRAATGSTYVLRYILKNYNLPAGDIAPSGVDPTTTYKSCDSGDFGITPQSGMSVVLIPSPTFGGSEGGVGGGTTGGGGQATSGAAGAAPRCSVSLQIRNQVQIKVTNVTAEGGVTDCVENNVSYGINDYYKSSVANGTTPAGGNSTPDMQGGSGSGCKLFLYQRDTDGRTMFSAVATPGTGYAVNDIITFDPLPGNTCYDGGSVKVPTAPGVSNPDGINNLTLDSYWDVMIHGVGGNGGQGGAGFDGSANTKGAEGGCQWVGAGRQGGTAQSNSGPGGDGGTMVVGQLYPIGATAGGQGSGSNNNAGGGGGGGAGWEGGKGGNNPSASNGGNGGGGGASMVDLGSVTEIQPTPTTYPDTGIDLYVNGVFVTSADTAGDDNQSVSYSLL